MCYDLMRSKRAGKIKIELSRAKLAENIWKNLPFIFFPEVDRLFISSIFKVRIFYFQKVPPPPPPWIKWSSPYVFGAYAVNNFWLLVHLRVHRHHSSCSRAWYERKKFNVYLIWILLSLGHACFRNILKYTDWITSIQINFLMCFYTHCLD